VIYRITDPFWAFFGRILVKPIILAALGLSMLFEGYRLFGPTEDSLGFMRRKLADRLCSQAAKDLPKKGGGQSLAVLSFAGDGTGYVTRLLRDKIEAVGEYRLLEDSFFRKLLREFGNEDVAVSLLTDAVATARKVGVDLVVFGEIPEFTAGEDRATFKLEVRMAERESGQAIFARSYSDRIGGSTEVNSYWRARLADSSKGRRIFIWVAFTLLLPLASVPLIRCLTAASSNMINLLMLLGYTLVDMLVALLLTGFWIPTLWTAGILLLALGASSYYNYRVASFIEEMGH